MAEKYIYSGDTVLGRYKEDDYPNIMSWPAWARKDLMQDWRLANPGRDENVIKAEEFLNFPASNYPDQLGLRGGVGDIGRLSVDDIMRITSYNSRRRSGLASGVNAIRAAMGQSGSFTLPTSGVSAKYLQTMMGLKDKEVLNRIIDMQSQAGLETDAEYRKWYSDWGFDPRFFDDSRTAWNAQKRSQEQTVKHDIEVGKEEERQIQAIVNGQVRQAITDGEITGVDTLRQYFVDNNIHKMFWDKAFTMADNYFTQRGEESALILKDKKGVIALKKAEVDLAKEKGTLVAKLDIERKKIVKKYFDTKDLNNWMKAQNELQEEIDKLAKDGVITATDRDQAFQELERELDHLKPIAWVSEIKRVEQYKKLADPRNKTEAEFAHNLSVLRAVLTEDFSKDPFLIQEPWFLEKISTVVEGMIQALMPGSGSIDLLEIHGAGTIEDPMILNRDPTPEEVTALIKRGIYYVNTITRLTQGLPKGKLSDPAASN